MPTDGNETISVTAMDANHCPGSAMFLFRGRFGAVLHTGDFRLHPSMLVSPALTGVTLTHMILDTTYNDPSYSFPSQDRAARAILDIVLRHRASGHRVIMGMDTVGKEELLLMIAEVMPDPPLQPANCRSPREGTGPGAAAVPQVVQNQIPPTTTTPLPSLF